MLFEQPRVCIGAFDLEDYHSVHASSCTCAGSASIVVLPHTSHDKALFLFGIRRRLPEAMGIVFGLCSLNPTSPRLA